MRNTVSSYSPRWRSAVTWWSGSRRAAAPERHRAAGPVLHAALQHRTGVDARGAQDTCRDARPHAGLADRHDRLVRVHAIGPESAQQPERDVERARDVGLVALGLLPHVEYLHGAFLEQPFQVVELDGYGGFRQPARSDVAGELEESDGAQPARGLLRLGVVGRVNDDSLVRIENESGAGRER